MMSGYDDNVEALPYRHMWADLDVRTLRIQCQLCQTQGGVYSRVAIEHSMKKCACMCVCMHVCVCACVCVV